MVKFWAISNPLAILYLIFARLQFTRGTVLDQPLTQKAACYGSCPGRGQPYTSRDCKPILGCRG
ncbi:hypothetical protein PTTG_25977 [Puccinia triticina 1-1 BBBD Race 1]|uniref:Uncharacterized protein n=1 Tax=Puccinia triticina (isolate 1-1 / race 1 (BBBD)) TaxID=630390 RepID=A0A180GYC0_PUCT1|nr:hypothetical protein PTTG_25977 [Puccinia triticina 1-1 BBBD Race 1]